MNVIRTHPLFPVRGTPQEQEAFTRVYSEKIEIIQKRNKEAKRVKNLSGTKRFLGTVSEAAPLVKVQAVCQAVNLNNTSCKFKATCGRFCKKHKVSAKDLELFEE